MTKKSKVVIIMPARNNEKTIDRTYKDIPNIFDNIIVNDNASKDRTVDVAKRLRLKVLAQIKDIGYGGAQKVLYKEALKQNADIIVMLHPDYQYDPKRIPELIKPITEGKYDIMLGSRMFGDPLRGGMPLWKFIGNKILTKIENVVLGLNLSEYHTGFRAYGRNFLETVPFRLNSDDFVFDQEIIIQAAAFGFKGRISEIGIPTRYFKEASTIGIIDTLKYALDILLGLLTFLLHKYRIKNVGNLMNNSTPLKLASKKRF